MGSQDDGLGRREGRTGHLVTPWRGRRTAGPAACFIAVIVLAALHPARAAETPSAIEIYDRTRATVAARRLPPFIAYTEDVAFARHGKTLVEHSRVILRTLDGRVNVTRIPDSPADRVDTAPVVKDRPLVFPTTSFGLVKRVAGERLSTYESAAAPPVAAEPNALSEIGRVRAVARDYDPTLVETETLGTATVYHLRLVPRFDPQHHPIRELYVDTITFDPRRITIEVYANAGPVHARPTVAVDFAPVEGTWLITHAALDFVLRFAFISYGGSGEYRTREVSFPAGEPDLLFEKHAAAPAASTR